MPDATPKPWGETTIVGKPIPRVDGDERLSGKATYSLDLYLPDMLYGATVRCPYPHANVKKVDLSEALRMPGVRAALSDADKEANIPWYGAPGGRSASRLFDTHCRFAGEEVAVIVAETQQQAWDAVRQVRVEYEQLKFTTDFEAALKSDAPPLHDGGNLAANPVNVTRGDVAKGFAEADLVLEETYRTPTQIHTPLETFGSVAKWDGDELTVWDTTQGVFPVQNSLANLLKMPLSKVRVIGHYMGGGFGAKLSLSKYTVMAALLARKTSRPVKLFLTREESFLCVGNRPAHAMTLKAGVKKDGTLTALEFTGVGEVGGYPGGSNAGYQVQDLWKCPNIHVVERSAMTPMGPARAFRAPGFPQGNWALEQMMDALAEKLGMDPIDLRLKNYSPMCQVEQKPYTSAGIPQLLTEGAKAFGWAEARARAKGKGPLLRGVGVASGMWGSPGRPPSTAIVRYYLDGSVNLNMGAADLGTGTKTVMAQVVSEELGVPLERIGIEWADTGTTQYTSASGGSKTVASDSPAVRAAALDVKRQLLALAAEQLKVPAESLTLKDTEISGPGGSPKVTTRELRTLQTQQVLVGVGIRGPNPTDKSVRPFSTHFAEVEVNTRTGEVRVVRMLAMHDSGRVMNAATFANQCLGGMTQGIGYATTERRVVDSNTGTMVNSNWYDYKIPTSKDIPPDLDVMPIDLHDHECDTTSTKGLGEPATIPVATAVANAFYNATGVRIKEGPITPAKVLMALAQRKG